MCGIFSLLNYKGKNLNIDFVKKQAFKSEHRGPEESSFDIYKNIIISFFRLAINGGKDGRQPLKINNKVLICNGEIYNFRKLYEISGTKPTTTSDCEVIIHMYEKYGIDYTIKCLDGVFAFMLIDFNINEIIVGRDQFGVRPLFCMQDTEKSSNLLGFSSEMKQLIDLKKNSDIRGEYDVSLKFLKIDQFKPGTYNILKLDDINNFWYVSTIVDFSKFHLTSANMTNHSESSILDSIHDVFTESIRKRVQDTTDRPIACLLSGGLDSSIVASLVSRLYSRADRILETYSIGLKNSEDLRYAKIVSEFIGSKHTEIVVSEEEFFTYIPKVIRKIESYDTTTVRASVGNLMISEYISTHSDAKVIFNGDGSDELMGGYLYMNYAPDALEFDKECKRLLSDIHYFDVLRSDRSISTNGLEPRTPFLDRDFVNSYLSIPATYRYTMNKKQEKYLFRKAFDRGYLPDEILWRRKEAFSDGVSSKDRSWYQIINEFVSKEEINFDSDYYTYNEPKTREQIYYRMIYEKHYANTGRLIPYFWMPKYIEATDASARTLDIYSES